jgi:hypothetical protein
LEQHEPHAVRTYALELREAFERDVAPGLLAGAVASVIYRLAARPFETQTQNWPKLTEARLDDAERWLAVAAW